MSANMGGSMSGHQETLAEKDASKKADLNEQKCDSSPDGLRGLLSDHRHLLDELEDTEEKHERTEIIQKLYNSLDKVRDCVKDETSPKQRRKQGKDESDSSTMDTDSVVDFYVVLESEVDSKNQEGPKSRPWKPSCQSGLPKTPSVTLIVMNPIDCDLRGADRAFLNACQKQVGKSVNLTIKLENKAAHGNARKFDILICPIMDRLGSSVDSAMRKAERAGDRRLVLVLFHHQAPHLALPIESDRLLTDDRYNRIGCIVDVVFWQNEGMYYCDSNTRAIHKVIGFIQDSLAE